MQPYDEVLGVHHAGIDVDSGTAAANVIAATSDKRIVVLGGLVTSTANDVVTFQSKPDGAGTELTGNGIPLLAAGANIAPLPYCPRGLFKTVAGEALQLSHSESGNIGGCLVYVLV